MVLFSEEEFHDVGKTVIHYITSNKENTGCQEMQAKVRYKPQFHLILPHRSLLDRTNCDEDVKIVKKWENMALFDDYIYF